MTAMFTKLKYCPYGNARVKHYADGTISLYSYETEVAVLKDGYLLVTGLYSATTRKHISYFMREFTSKDYYFAKAIAYKPYAMNILNGDIIPLNDFYKMVQ